MNVTDHLSGPSRLFNWSSTRPYRASVRIFVSSSCWHTFIDGLPVPLEHGRFRDCFACARDGSITSLVPLEHMRLNGSRALSPS
jgi:hypothetical protein